MYEETESINKKLKIYNDRKLKKKENYLFELNIKTFYRKLNEEKYIQQDLCQKEITDIKKYWINKWNDDEMISNLNFNEKYDHKN